MSFLEISGLTVAYHHLVAVRRLSAGVDQGAVLGVIGPNGAGKSSLLRAVAGLVRPVAGGVRLDGQDLANHSVERRARLGIALSPEGRGILGPLTVAENLRLGAYPCGRLSSSELASRRAAMYELFPVLGERASQPGRTLSGGEAAMLSIARALMSRPRLLLLDEPTLGLAPRVSEAVFDRITALKRAGQTMVIVEQRAADLLDVADNVLAMRRGEAQALAPAEQLRGSALNDLYFGTAPENGVTPEPPQGE